jgi:hypothetical protein
MMLFDVVRRRGALRKRLSTEEGQAGRDRPRREKRPAVWQMVSSQPSSGSGKKVLILGHSHMNALAKAARTMVRVDEFPPGLTMSFIQLRNPVYQPIRTANGQLNPTLVNNIEKYSDGADLAISCIGGNSHHIMGLLNHPRAYDFILDTDPSIRVEPSREIVPCALVRAALKDRMKSGLALMAKLRAAVKVAMVHLESPPPIASEDHIHTYPGKFSERIGALGISPAHIRFKLWKLQSDICRVFCDEHDIAFWSVPPEVCDENGMLAEKAWGFDSTHGNEWYGKHVINQITAFADTSGKKANAPTSV